MKCNEDWLNLMVDIGKLKRKYNCTNNELCLATRWQTEGIKEWLIKEYAKKITKKDKTM